LSLQTKFDTGVFFGIIQSGVQTEKPAYSLRVVVNRKDFRLIFRKIPPKTGRYIAVKSEFLGR
jgi:hypothetical protein